jgi:hypothetical protein
MPPDSFAKAAREIDDENDDHEQANRATTVNRAAEIEAAASEQKQEHNENKNSVHDPYMTLSGE